MPTAQLHAEHLPWLPGPPIIAGLRAWTVRGPCPLPDDEAPDGETL